MSLVICTGDGVDYKAAVALSEKVNAPISDSLGEDLTLLLDASGLSLIGYGLKYQGDFEQMVRRVTAGRLHHEMLVHIAKTKQSDPKAIDATAGMGEDAFLLAACGYEVTMYERNPVIVALLQDALKRASANSFLKDIIGRMHLIEGNSIELIPTLGKVDLVYLDPMFPARKKSGLINKKLQLIQKLEQPCVDESALFAAAQAVLPQKIIIKRPLKGDCLANVTPHYTIKGKAIRYDCFSFPNNARE